MAYDYTSLSGTAASLIGSFGRAITLKKRVQGAYSTSTSSATITPTNYAVRGVFPTSGRGRRGESSAEAGTKSLMLAAQGLAVVPGVDDQIVDGSDTYQILSVDEIKPGDKVLAYSLQVRK